jgi:hypothetical protein
MPAPLDGRQTSRLFRRLKGDTRVTYFLFAILA